MMSLDLNSDVQIGKSETFSKPNKYIYCKNFVGEISLSNQLTAIIKDIENGKLLSSVTLK